MQELSLDRVRIAIDWRNREPERLSYYWEPMDVRMQAAKDSNLKVFLTIESIGPSWATIEGENDNLFDETALKSFMESILLRYDNIDKIQFGNEWETGTGGYTDWPSLQKFVLYTNMLYEAVQEISPKTQVVLGGITRLYPMMEHFLGNDREPDLSYLQLTTAFSPEDLLKRIKRNRTTYEKEQTKQRMEYVFQHARYDILDIHLYDDAENWEEYLSALPKGKPIVVSEFGGPSSEFEVTKPSYHGQRMEAYIDAIEKLPILEAYYFKLVDSEESYHKHSGLFDKNLKKKPAYKVFADRLSPGI